MSDTLSTITHLIQSPPGQLAAGGVLAGIVWKFFERVKRFGDDTTLETDGNPSLSEKGIINAA